MVKGGGDPSSISPPPHKHATDPHRFTANSDFDVYENVKKEKTKRPNMRFTGVLIVSTYQTVESRSRRNTSTFLRKAPVWSQPVTTARRLPNTTITIIVSCYGCMATGRFHVAKPAAVLLRTSSLERGRTWISPPRSQVYFRAVSLTRDVESCTLRYVRTEFYRGIRTNISIARPYRAINGNT